VNGNRSDLYPKEETKVSQALENDELRIRYLLGELSAEEQAKLEDEYFTQDNSFEQLLAIEDELIDAYVRGKLPERERTLFETHFLSTPKRRERVAFARELLRAIASKGAPLLEQASASARPAIGSEKIPWWRSSFSPLFGWRPAVGFSFAAALLLLLVIGGVWFIQKRNAQRARQEQEILAEQRRQHEQEKAAQDQANANQYPVNLNATTPAPPDIASQQPTPEKPREQSPKVVTTPPQQAPTTFFAVLSPNLVRGSGAANRLVIPPGTDRVQLQLNLKASDDYSSYRASIKTVEGRLIKSLSARPTSSGTRAVTVVVPARDLPPGDYILSLKGSSATHEIKDLNEYYFRVTQR
jgi:hypothetical protein